MFRFSATRSSARVFTLASLLALTGMLFASPDRANDKAREDAVKKAVDAFKDKIKTAKAPEQKAQLILEMGEFQYKDSAIVSALGRYMSPSGKDINYIVPVVTAQALAKFRGNGRASATLMGSLRMYKRIPYVHDEIIKAIGQVGHQSALALFDKDLKNDKVWQPAVKAVEAIGDFPGHIAMPVLFGEYKRLDKRKNGAQDPLKTFIDKVQPAILGEIKNLSGEAYPTMKEMQIWWDRRGQRYLDKAKKEEEDRLNAKPDPNAPKPVLPPVKIFDIGFDENKDEEAKNIGASSAHFPKATLSDPGPAWSTNKAVGGASSVNFGKQGSMKAVDIRGQIPHLMTLKSFTITGWVNLQDEPATEEGTPVVSWLFPKKDGVELLYRKGGILQLGINEPAKDSAAKSKEKQIPDLDEASTATNKQRNNWRFFAVSYDSGLATGHVKFYFGTFGGNAKLVSTVDYDMGPVGRKIAPCLTIGNVVNLERARYRDRSFSGLIDEIKIFGSTVNGSGALTLKQIVEAQDRAQN